MIKKVSMLSHESAQVAIGVMNPKTQSVLLLSPQVMKCGTDMIHLHPQNHTNLNVPSILEFRIAVGELWDWVG